MKQQDILEGQFYTVPKRLITRLAEDNSFDCDPVRIQVEYFQSGCRSFAVTVYDKNNNIYLNEFSTKGYFYIYTTSFIQYFNKLENNKEKEFNKPKLTDYKYLYEVVYLTYKVNKSSSFPDGLIHKYILSNDHYYLNDIVFVTSKSHDFTIVQILDSYPTQAVSDTFFKSALYKLYDAQIVCSMESKEVIQFLSKQAKEVEKQKIKTYLTNEYESLTCQLEQAKELIINLNLKINQLEKKLKNINQD